MTYQQTSGHVMSDGLPIICKRYQIAQGAVIHNGAELLALNQRVMTTDGEGKVIWFTATGTAIVVLDAVDSFGHRLIRGYQIAELRPCETEGEGGEHGTAS